MGAISVSANESRISRRRWLHLFLVMAMVVTNLVFVGSRVEASNHVTGLGSETGTAVNTFDFIDLEVDEVQSVGNNATGGTFTLSFDGQGPTDPIRYDAPLADLNEIQTLYNNATGGTFTIGFDGQSTGPIAYNALAATVDTALEGLNNIAAVTVTGTGILADPWVITFVDPGSQDVPEITTVDASLVGGTSTIATTQDGNLSVESALEALSNIVDVSVAGAGTLGSPWLVTFLDPGGAVPALLTASDAGLTGGTTTILEATPGDSAPIDPAGLTYLGGGEFLLVDSEINEEPTVYDGVNIWQVTDVPAVTRTSKWEVPSVGSTEPTGLAFNPAGNGRIYISDDNAKVVHDVDLGGNGVFDHTDSFTTLDVGVLGLADPEDVAYDPVSGQVFVASGNLAGSEPRTVTPVSPGGDGMLGTLDDVVGATMDFSLMLGDLEGIGYRAASDTLLLVDPTGTEKIFEVTKDGRLVREINIGFTRLPSDVTLAPASGGGGENMYVVDRMFDNNTAEPPPRDGRWYEISAPFENLAPFVDAGSDQVLAFGSNAVLIGDSYDDGQGSAYSTPPFVPSVFWSKVSGPGTVAFANPNALGTNASFSAAGDYVLKLQASDGDNTSEDLMTVTVTAPTGGGGAVVTPTCPANLANPGFTDLGGLSAEAVHAIWCLSSYEITKGTSPTTFSPNIPVARWQMALFLTRQISVHGFTLPAVEDHGFTDIDGLTTETQNAINQLATLGITKGTGPTTFDPNSEVSRWQMALFLTRLADLVGLQVPSSPSSNFVDLGGLSAEARLAIEQLATMGIAKGTSATTFTPLEDVMRWQMGLFLTRVLAADGVLPQ